jgi:hypothetical protein
VRVLITTSNRSVLGGVEKYLQLVIPGLLRRGHNVGLVYEYPYSPAEEAIDSAAESLQTWCSGELGVDSVLRSIGTWAPDVVY